MEVSIRQMRAFIAVARLKSFTRAAKAMNLSQPALTVQIRRMEEAMALKLFDRNSRSVAITQVGRELFPVLQRMVQDIENLIVTSTDQSSRRGGIVRVAALPSVASSLLPIAIQTFRKHSPAADFRVHDAVASRVLELVGTEVADLGITGGRINRPDIEVLAVAHDQLHVIFPKSHPLAGIRKVTAKALARCPLVMMDPETSVRSIVDTAFHEAGLMPQPVCETTYMMTAISMVQAGLGITILPGAAREISAFPNLLSRPIGEKGFAREISLVKKAGRTLSPLSGKFADHVLLNLPGRDHRNKTRAMKAQ